ncbi:hypothetical protein Tco_0191058 [Tanacetum coccineum]
MPKSPSPLGSKFQRLFGGLKLWQELSRVRFGVHREMILGQPLTASLAHFLCCILLLFMAMGAIGHLKGAAAGTVQKAMDFLTGKKEAAKKLSETRLATKNTSQFDLAIGKKRDPKGNGVVVAAPVSRVEALVVDDLRRRGRQKLMWEDRVKLDMKELLLSKNTTSDRNE